MMIPIEYRRYWPNPLCWIFGHRWTVKALHPLSKDFNNPEQTLATEKEIRRWWDMSIHNWPWQGRIVNRHCTRCARGERLLYIDRYNTLNWMRGTYVCRPTKGWPRRIRTDERQTRDSNPT